MNSSQETDVDFANPGNNGVSNQKTMTQWRDIVSKYEKRNASLENRQSQLSERLRAMECALPSMLMSAMVSMHYGTEPPKMNMESVLSGVKTEQSNANDARVKLVFKRTDDVGDPKNSSGNSRFATGDDGHLNHDQVGPADGGGRPGSADSVTNLSVMSSRDLMALGRIQELAEQERLLKRYICDLESREKTFCQTLERANRLLNDPLECVQECLPVCRGTEAKEPLSDDPVIQRLQKLEFYNKRMIMSMKGLREEKNVLIKQTEFLKTQLRNTQEKLGEVQKEVLGEAKVIPVMGEASFTAVKGSCSCASTSNKENSDGKNSDPKTLVDLAEQFEDVLQKAKIHGLCKLTGTIKDAATKLKELSKSEEGYKCICDCPCQPAFKRAGPCSNCKCGKFDADKLGETGDWFCDSCGGECICDLISLDEDSSDSSQSRANNCECGCQDDKIACECGCGTSNVNEIGEAGNIPKTAARKLSEDLKGIICKDCGNCKCGDDHSKCPDCIEACTCSCTTDTITESLQNRETKGNRKEDEHRDADGRRPRCACNDSNVTSPKNDAVEQLRKKFVFPSEGRSRNPDLHPCFECEQSKPCDVCRKEEFNRLEQSKTIARFGLQRPLPPAVHAPCKDCLKFGVKTNKDHEISSLMCNLCKVEENTTFQARQTEVLRAEDLDHGSGDQMEPQNLHDPNCPCSCNETASSNKDECLCGSDVTVKVIDDAEENRCPCGCGQVVGLNTVQESGCDCECAKGGVHCDYCCCVESILEILNADEIAREESPEICPCIEDSVREAEREDLAKMLQQDVDCIGKKNNLLRQLVAQCACAGTEVNQESCPYHDLAPIRPTVSGLQAAIELLRVKNRSKDGMIAVLAGNIGGRVDAEKIIEYLAAPMMTDTSQDFDQCGLYSYLKRSEPSENAVQSRHEYLPPESRGAQSPDKFMAQPTDPEIQAWSHSVIPPPRDLKVIEQICNDCLLVTWTPPDDITALKGYELLVNGYLANRVRSPTRTEALLVSLDMSRPVIVTLYSLGPGGSSSDPVRITYPACPCVQD